MDKFKRAVTIGYGEGVQALPHCQGPGGTTTAGGHCQQWGGEGRQTLEDFASGRQGGRGQEQEGGAGEEGVQCTATRIILDLSLGLGV